LVCEECRIPHQKEVRLNKVTGRRTCRQCYRELHQPKYICGDCGALARVAAWEQGVPFCPNCYENSENCGVCSQYRYVIRRLPDGQAMCRTCTRNADDHLQVCHICQHSKICLFQSSSGWVCEACYNDGRKNPCSQCGQTRVVNRRINGHPWCQMCARKRHPTQ